MIEQAPTVSLPRSPADHSDRHLNCQEAIEPAFAMVKQAAREAGWSDDQVAAAMLELAKAGILALMENRRTDDAIRRAQNPQ